MKKILLILVILSLTLFAQEENYDDVLSYSDFNVNDSVSLYAGKINMDYFLESEAYSVGLLMQDNSDKDMEFGVGYIQPASKFVGFAEVEPSLKNETKGDGVLFFMNYNF